MSSQDAKSRKQGINRREFLLTTAAAVGVLSKAPPSLGGLLTGTFMLTVLLTGIGVYFDIVLMRLIGLYYHHFKHRFAWSWE